MKKLLVILLSMFILIGCAGNNGVYSMSKKLNNEDVKALLTEVSISLQNGELEKQSVLEYYQNVVSVLEDPETSIEEGAQEFANDFVQYAKTMVAALESDNATTAFVGAASQVEARGIILMKFEYDIQLDPEMITRINESDFNGFEHIYVYKNVVVTVDYDFVTDYNTLFELVDEVVKDAIDK